MYFGFALRLFPMSCEIFLVTSMRLGSTLLFLSLFLESLEHLI